MISSHEIVYLKPAFFDETVSIQSSLFFLSANSLYVEILLMNESKSQLRAILRSRLILINLKTGKREPHKPEFMDWARSLLVEEGLAKMEMKERIGGVGGEVRKCKLTWY